MSSFLMRAELTRPHNMMEDITLLNTKLYIPQVSNQLVPRPRLFDRLNEGLETNDSLKSAQIFKCKVTLVSAPAGYGKTTLVASWLKNIKTRSAWIALDENDDDFLVFVRYLIAAVRSLFPESCAYTAQLTQESSEVTPGYLATTLVNDLDSIQQTFILVFDDFHLIRNRAIISLISQLINNQPSNVHLIIVSRTDPILPLSRLRAAGDMNEIRSPELRFQNDEAERYIRQEVGLSVDQNSIIVLNQQTEGWVVGLRLALFSIRGQKDISDLIERFRNMPNRYVRDYLISEVLAQQPEAIRTILMRSSILKRMSGPLLEALMDADDSDFNGQAFLEWLVASNLFVFPLDDQREWFRYHHLFQTILENNLRANYSDSEISAFHYRASRWFSDLGYVEEAIQHALAADNIDLAIMLVEEQSQNLLNSQNRSTLERWLNKLPPDIIWQRPILLITKAWLLYREWRIEALQEILNAVEVNLSKEPLPKSAQSMEGQIAALRSAPTYMLWEDYSQTVSLANRALELLPGTESGARGTAVVFRALAQQALGERVDAVHSLETIVQSPIQLDASKIQPFIGLAMLHQMAGDLQLMSRISDQFLNLADNLKHPNAITAANRFAGWLSYEWNDLNKATEQFLTVIDNRYRGNFISYYYAVMGLVRIHLAQGQLAKARRRLEDIRAETLRLNHRILMNPLEALEADIWILYRDIHSALRWARSLDPQSYSKSNILLETSSLTHTRILIQHGTNAEVLSVKDRLILQLARAKAHHFPQRVIQIQIHLALAYERLGDRDQALNSIEQAVLLAQPGSFIRTFVDIGQPLRELLNALSSRIPDVSQPYLMKLLASFEEEAYLRSSLLESQRQEMGAITKRELNVLRLMQAKKTDVEIAAELVIALSTARKHASNIYRKLDVNNRWQAVQKAEELGIL